MQIAICDDEKLIREQLAGKLQKLCPDAHISDYASGEALLSADEEPDILFLDIQMQGMGGMEAAKELRKKNKKLILIFVTALEEYVFQAFDVGAFHYLVKPFSDEKFTSVFQKAAKQYKELEEKDKTVEDHERYLMITSKGIHRKVLMEDIIFAEVFNRKVVIHTKQEEIEYYGKLSDLENKAGEDFFRTHRAYLVHFKYVVKYDASTVWLKKGEALIAKPKYPAFVQSYLQYNRRKGRGL